MAFADILAGVGTGASRGLAQIQDRQNTEFQQNLQSTQLKLQERQQKEAERKAAMQEAKDWFVDADDADELDPTHPFVQALGPAYFTKSKSGKLAPKLTGERKRNRLTLDTLQANYDKVAREQGLEKAQTSMKATMQLFQENNQWETLPASQRKAIWYGSGASGDDWMTENEKVKMAEKLALARGSSNERVASIYANAGNHRAEINASARTAGDQDKFNLALMRMVAQTIQRDPVALRAMSQDPNNFDLNGYVAKLAEGFSKVPEMAGVAPSAPNSANGMVTLINPRTGKTLKVPPNEVEEALAAGAVRP